MYLTLYIFRSHGIKKLTPCTRQFLKIQSDQKTTFLYPDVSNVGKLRVTKRLFGMELDEGETEILKAVLEKYEEHE